MVIIFQVNSRSSEKSRKSNRFKPNNIVKPIATHIAQSETLDIRS